MAAAAISGVAGDFKVGSTSVFEACKWTFSAKCNVPSYASNKTGGYKARPAAGVKDATFKLEGKYVLANPIEAVADVGTLFTANMYLDSSHFFAVPGAVDSLELMVDMDTGDLIGYSMTGGSNGAWSNPTSP